MGTRLPILMFHDFSDQRAPISFPAAVFQRAMARLHSNGFRTLTLLEAVHCLQRRSLFPNRSFAITFDDGYRTVYDRAFPVLQRYGMTGTVFVTPGVKKPANSAERLPALEGRMMLSWHQIREMQDAGMDIGAHSCTHPRLTELPMERARAEILGSRSIIQEMLGQPVACFAYPFGRYDVRIRDLAAQHFCCALSDKLGFVTASSDPFALERVDAHFLRSDRTSALMVGQWFPWYVGARSLTRGIKRAVQRRLA
jgi:peptidoglycan/xylan/chitin deacetylase (PgdA/CDA1 family)